MLVTPEMVTFLAFTYPGAGKYKKANVVLKQFINTTA
jgi:hypothetical protein